MVDAAFQQYLAQFGYHRDDGTTVTYRKHQASFGGAYSSTWLADKDTGALQKVDFYGANPEQPIFSLNAQNFGYLAYIHNLYRFWLGWGEIGVAFTVDNARNLLSDFFRLDRSKEQVVIDQSGLDWSTDSLRLYERNLSGDPTQYTTTYSYGSRANYEAGNLQSVELEKPGLDEHLTPAQLQTRLRELGIDYGYYFTYT